MEGPGTLRGWWGRNRDSHGQLVRGPLGEHLRGGSSRGQHPRVGVWGWDGKPLVQCLRQCCPWEVVTHFCSPSLLTSFSVQLSHSLRPRTAPCPPRALDYDHGSAPSLPSSLPVSQGSTLLKRNGHPLINLMELAASARRWSLAPSRQSMPTHCSKSKWATLTLLSEVLHSEALGSVLCLGGLYFPRPSGEVGVVGAPCPVIRGGTAPGCPGEGRGTVVRRPCPVHHAVCLAKGAPSSNLHEVPQRLATPPQGPDFKAEETRIRGG